MCIRMEQFSISSFGFSRATLFLFFFFFLFVCRKPKAEESDPEKRRVFQDSEDGGIPFGYVVCDPQRCVYVVRAARLRAFASRMRKSIVYISDEHAMQQCAHNA